MRRAEGLSASPGSYPQSRPRASSARHKSTPPSVEIQGCILPTVESSPRPPRRRGKPTTKNGEENKHSDSPDPVDDTQTFYRRRERRTRRTSAAAWIDLSWGDYFVRSFDQIRSWWNSMERNASRGIVSTPLDLFNPLKYNDRTRISFGSSNAFYLITLVIIYK